MRFFAIAFLTGLLAVVGCAGDSSSVMSVWNDSGAGGTGGSTAEGGSGGQVSTETISVVGGIRDVATAQCISTSGGACSLSSADLSCLKGNCGSSLAKCYSTNGTAAGGQCLTYANCMLQCPCNAGKSNCENNCFSNDVTAIPDCYSCIIDLSTCASRYSCPMTSAC